MTTILVAGATGMTGRSVVEQLLDDGHSVRAIVRSPDKLAERVVQHPNLTIIQASILDVGEDQMTQHVKDCTAVVSCLGHVLSVKGMFGKPHDLCTAALRSLCHAIANNDQAKPAKVILMNTVGVSNPALTEKRSLAERALLSILRNTIPPHRDNETAAHYLSRQVGTRNKLIEWCVVRPDSLINADVSPFEIVASPTTGIFSGRPTTRANVAKFMTQLVADDALWNKWKFAMPVIMNAAD